MRCIKVVFPEPACRAVSQTSSLRRLSHAPAIPTHTMATGCFVVVAMLPEGDGAQGHSRFHGIELHQVAESSEA
jgi:hypothetical protein